MVYAANNRPPRILSTSSIGNDLDAISPRRGLSQNSKRNPKGFMASTQSSRTRAHQNLNLREKIFELHDAVKELQTKPPTVIVTEEQT